MQDDQRAGRVLGTLGVTGETVAMHHGLPTLLYRDRPDELSFPFLPPLAASEPTMFDTPTYRPWVEANRVLIQRAIDRGEFPPGDVEALAQVIPTMCAGRAVQQLPITREFSLP